MTRSEVERIQGPGETRRDYPGWLSYGGETPGEKWLTVHYSGDRVDLVTGESLLDGVVPVCPDSQGQRRRESLLYLGRASSPDSISMKYPGLALTVCLRGSSPWLFTLGDAQPRTTAVPSSERAPVQVTVNGVGLGMSRAEVEKVFQGEKGVLQPGGWEQYGVKTGEPTEVSFTPDGRVAYVVGKSLGDPEPFCVERHEKPSYQIGEESRKALLKHLGEPDQVKDSTGQLRDWGSVGVVGDQIWRYDSPELTVVASAEVSWTFLLGTPPGSPKIRW